MANTHSRNFEKVKKFFLNGAWSESRVKDAVIKGWITAEEFKEITDSEYVE